MHQLHRSEGRPAGCPLASSSSETINMLLLLLLVLAAALSSSTQLCQGNTKCALCTVTGPAVIDIHGQLSSVQERCAYTLLKTSVIPDLQVFATFQERRRKDVSFLDIVILDKTDVHIKMEQGGRVQVDNVTKTLSAAAQDVNGVQLSKDSSGVTAKMSHAQYTVTVFFDGYAAQIHIAGPAVPAVEGLCSNSSTPLGDLKSSSYSTNGCDTLHQDEHDNSIQCSKMTEHCNLLTKAPFDSCLSNVSPHPFVAACNDTLCKYPDLDGLKCQFLEIYSRACSLYSSSPLQGWRSTTGCSAGPQAFCQNRYCSSHEFCGENSSGDGHRCHCRAIFASAYRTNKTLGDAVVCSGSSRSAALVGCLLEDRGINYSELQLNDKTCRGEMDNETHMVKFSFDAKAKPCGTIITMNKDNELINKNSVVVETTREQLLGLTCPFVLPDIDIDFSMGIKVIGGTSSGVVEYITTGNYTYTLTMTVYTDVGRTKPVNENTTLQLNQRVWFEIKTEGLDDKLVAVVTDSCFATNIRSASSTLKYDLIVNGCPDPGDGTVKVESNGEGTSNYFSFVMFQFTGKTGNVYLHCKLKLCSVKNNTCKKNCNSNSRRRRSAEPEYQEENSSFVIMAWGT